MDFADSFNKSTSSRLLIPGVPTYNIITCFINTIKILQVIDPLGLIFGMEKFWAYCLTQLFHRFGD